MKHVSPIDTPEKALHRRFHVAIREARCCKLQYDVHDPGVRGQSDCIRMQSDLQRLGSQPLNCGSATAQQHRTMGRRWRNARLSTHGSAS